MHFIVGSVVNGNTRGKFLRMGEKAGLLNRLVNAEIDKLLAQLSKILVPFTEKMQQSEPSSIYSGIQSGIEKRILQLKA